MRDLIGQLASMSGARRWAVVLWITGAVVASVSDTGAQVPAAPPTPGSPAPTANKPIPAAPWLVPLDDFGRGTPQGAVEGFLSAADRRDYGRAAAYLDLSRLPADRAAREGPTLARHLRVVLDQVLLLDPSEFSPDPAGMPDDGQPAGRDLIGRIETKKGGVTLFLERIPRDDGVPVWKVAAGTVGRIPALYEEFGHGPMGEVLPAALVETRLFDIALWQWIALLFLVPISILVAGLLVMPVGRLLRALSTRGHFPLAVRIAQNVAGPIHFLIALGLFHFARRALGLALAVHHVFLTVEEVLVIVGATWLLLRVIDVGGVSVRKDMDGQRHAATIAVADLAQRALTLIVLLLGFFSLLEALGVHVTALIAGLGVGGIALALAAQKTVEHLLGGASLVADQPVQVGDFCRFGDRLGTVEWIGLRSTRVRTLDRTLVSIPNGEFASLQIENFAKRDRIWLHSTVRLRYETTSEQLRHVLVRLRELLYSHPMIYPSPARVRLVNLGPDALELEVFAYVRTANNDEFLSVREDLYLRMLDIIAESGAKFALPSQTIHWADEGTDRERARAAEAEVRRWRAEGTLPMPDFPPERVQKMSATLDYPPKGSPERPHSSPTGRG